MVLHLLGFDDIIACYLLKKNRPVERVGYAEFLDPQKHNDITDRLHPGKNILNCQVTDRDNGRCYGWEYAGTAGMTAIGRSADACCNGPPPTPNWPKCIKNGNPVLNENTVINYRRAK